MDIVMEEQHVAKKLKEMFLGRGAENNSNAGFADTLNTIFWGYQASGMTPNSRTGLQAFCEWISMDAATNKTAPEAGWAATKGALPNAQMGDLAVFRRGGQRSNGHRVRQS
jgi:hypothetical protein